MGLVFLVPRVVSRPWHRPARTGNSRGGGAVRKKFEASSDGCLINRALINAAVYLSGFIPPDQDTAGPGLRGVAGGIMGSGLQPSVRAADAGRLRNIVFKEFSTFSL